MKPGTVVTRRQVASKIYEPDSPENIRLAELAEQFMGETRREKAAADARWEDEAQARAMGPDYSRKGKFVSHNCAYCRNGELPCKQGEQNRCDNPRARND